MAHLKNLRCTRCTYLAFVIYSYTPPAPWVFSRCWTNKFICESKFQKINHFVLLQGGSGIERDPRFVEI